MTSPNITPEQGEWTKGPWSVVRYGDGDSLVIHSSEDIRVCFMATPGSPSAGMGAIPANARLIAASPDMHEALAKCLALIDDMSRFVGQMSLQDYALFNEAPMLARRALSKATSK